MAEPRVMRYYSLDRTYIKIIISLLGLALISSSYEVEARSREAILLGVPIDTAAGAVSGAVGAVGAAAAGASGTAAPVAPPNNGVASPNTATPAAGGGATPAAGGGATPAAAAGGGATPAAGGGATPAAGGGATPAAGGGATPAAAAGGGATPAAAAGGGATPAAAAGGGATPAAAAGGATPATAAPGAAANGSPAVGGAAPGAAGGGAAAPTTTAGGPKVFDVTAHGAKPNDDSTDNAMPFIQAWNAACKSGCPAKLLIPEGTYTVGQVVFQGPCTGSNPMIVEVKGTMKAVNDISLYPDGDWFLFENIDGLEVNGGVWDGQGQTMWEFNDCKTNKECQHLPVSVHFNRVKNAKIEGLTSVNSMGFHMSTTYCSHVKMHKLNISAPDESPNTDGIHVSTTDNLEVTQSVIGTGDDCLGIIQGANNISVNQVVCGPGHGISIGSLGRREDEKDVDGVHVWNCTLKNTDNGVRIKSFAGELQLQASNIIFEDIIMESVKNPILIDQHYGAKRNSNKHSRVVISGVHYRKIRGTTISENPIALLCSKIAPCKGVEFADVDLTYNGAKPLCATSICENVQATFSGKINPAACKV